MAAHNCSPTLAQCQRCAVRHTYDVRRRSMDIHLIFVIHFRWNWNGVADKRKSLFIDWYLWNLCTCARTHRICITLFTWRGRERYSFKIVYVNVCMCVCLCMFVWRYDDDNDTMYVPTVVAAHPTIYFILFFIRSRNLNFSFHIPFYFFSRNYLFICCITDNGGGSSGSDLHNAFTRRH